MRQGDLIRLSVAAVLTTCTSSHQTRIPDPIAKVSKASVQIAQCLRTAREAAADGRLDIAAAALDAAAVLEPTAARRLAASTAWHAAGSPHRAAAALIGAVRGHGGKAPQAHALDPALVDATWRAAAAGNDADLVASLGPYEKDLSPDMLIRLETAMRSLGDSQGARRVSSRLRASLGDRANGFQVLGVGSAPEFLDFGPHGLLLARPPGIEVILPDSKRRWSRLKLEGTAQGWFGQGRALLTQALGHIQVLNADDGNTLAERSSFLGVTGMAVNADRSLAVILTSEGLQLVGESLNVIEKWDFRLGVGSPEPLLALAPTGDRIALVTGKTTLIFDRSSRALQELPTSDRLRTAAAFRTSNQLVTLDDEGRMLVHDLRRTGKIPRRVDLCALISADDCNGSSKILSAALSSTGYHVAAAFENELVVIDIRSGTATRRTETWSGPPKLRFAADGRSVSATDARSLRVFTVEELVVRVDIRRGENTGSLVGIDAEAQLLMTSGAVAKTWSLQHTDAEPRVIRNGRLHAAERTEISDNKRTWVFVAGSALTVQRDDQEFVLPSPTTEILDFAVDPDGQYIVFGRADGIWLWNLDHPKPRRFVDLPDDEYRNADVFCQPLALRFATGAQWLMAGCGSFDELRVWNLTTGAATILREVKRTGLMIDEPWSLVYWNRGVIMHRDLGVSVWDGLVCRECDIDSAALLDPRSVVVRALERDGTYFHRVDLATGESERINYSGHVTDPGLERDGPFFRTAHGATWFDAQFNRVLSVAVDSTADAWMAVSPEGLITGHLGEVEHFALLADKFVLDVTGAWDDARVPDLVTRVFAGGPAPACAVEARGN